MVFCLHCGKEITDEAAVCVHCGRQVKPIQKTSTRQPDPEESSTATKVVLASVGSVVGILGLLILIFAIQSFIAAANEFDSDDRFAFLAMMAIPGILLCALSVSLFKRAFRRG